MVEIKKDEYQILRDITIGHRPLVEEPLTKDDWAEVYHAFKAFQYHLRLIVLRARKRKVP